MGTPREIFVPDIGDFKNVDVVEVLVKPGDTVKPEQSLISVESDKATMEIPSPAAGEGISIVALSDSTLMSDCSGFTVSPGLTRTSTTSTFLKSPMSGTKISLGVPMRCALPESRPAPVAGTPSLSPDQTVTGLGFSVSIRYFLIASETTLDLISP